MSDNMSQSRSELSMEERLEQYKANQDFITNPQLPVPQYNRQPQQYNQQYNQ